MPEVVRSARQRVASWGLAIAVVLAGGQAHGRQPAASKQACSDAYVASQKLRKDGKLTKAHEQLLVCAQQSCPTIIKNDCLRWLSDTEQNLPTIVVAAKGPSGDDITDVAVYIDDVKVTDALDGRAIPIDPGAHSLRFERAGSDPVEKRVVVQQGMKNRPLSITFAPKQDAVSTPAPEPEGGEPDAPISPEPERSQPVAAYVLWGLSLVGFGMFAGFGVVGKKEADDLDTTCGENAPPPDTQTCTDEEISDVRTKLIVADVSLGVGIAAFVTGTVLFIYNRVADPPASAWRIDLGPTPDGLYAGVSGRF